MPYPSSRRDGSPFINLLMLAPLRDINGNIRYVLGAQIDVSNLVPDTTHLAGTGSPRTTQEVVGSSEDAGKREDLRYLSEMLDLPDRGKIQKWRASTVQDNLEDDARLISSSDWRRPASLARGQSMDSFRDNDFGGWVNSRLCGFYQNVSLVPIPIEASLKLAVSCHSTVPVFACSLHFRVFATTGHSAVTHLGQD